MKLNRESLRLLRPEIEAALAALGQKHGIRFRVGTGTYDPTGNHAHFRLEMGTVTADGTVHDPAADAFKAHANLFGLQPTDLGRTFTMRGKAYTITGLKPRSGTYPVLAADASGKVFKFNHRDVARLLPQATPPAATPPPRRSATTPDGF